MTDKNVLKDFTIEELLEEAATRQEADEWVEEPFGETTKQWVRYMHSWKSIMQQIVERDDGTWECASHFAFPSATFDKFGNLC